MTKNEWYDLIAKEFDVSRNVAKTMFHEMVKIKEIKSKYTMADALRKAGMEVKK